MTMPSALKIWIESRPGPFAARTHAEVWATAWWSFCAGPTGGLHSELDFMVQLREAGFDIRSLAVGGYALDKL